MVQPMVNKRAGVLKTTKISSGEKDCGKQEIRSTKMLFMQEFFKNKSQLSS